MSARQRGASLSIAKAVQLAEAWAKSEFKRYDSAKTNAISLTSYGCPDQKERWYYVLHFSPMIDGHVLFGSGHFSGVLMDGTVISPTKVE